MAVVLRHLGDGALSAAFNPHPEQLSLLLKATHSPGLTTEPEKCQLRFEESRFMARVINAQGVGRDPDNISEDGRRKVSLAIFRSMELFEA